MATCLRCRTTFNLIYAKRRVDHLYGAGIYDDYFPDGDVCDKCAIEELSCDYGTGEEEIGNMGSGWD